MKINKRLLWVIVFIAGLSFYILYSTPIFLQFGDTNFPLKTSWSQKLSNAIVDISTSNDNSVILARTQYRLYALQAVNGKVVWSFPLAKQVYHSPARNTGKTVYVTDSKFLYAIRINDGSEIWKQPLPESGGRLVDLSESLILVNQTSYDIRAYNTQSGQLLWTAPVGRGFVQAYINDDTVYIADDGINAVKASTGESVWQHGNKVIGESTYNEKIIYYRSSNKVTAFDTQIQHELWNASLPENGFLRFKLGGDYLFVMDESNFYVFNKSNGILEWQEIISHPMNPVVIEKNLYVLEGFNRVIRVFNLATKTEIGHLRISAPQLSVVENQDMYSSPDILLFSIGHDIFAYK